MRINSIPPKELYNKYIHVREKPTAEQPVHSTDKAELTTDAKTFSSALKAAKESMSVRTPEDMERINQIAEQVKNNTYSVPGSKVAEKILGK